MTTGRIMSRYEYDVVVVGAGHAGVEAALADENRKQARHDGHEVEQAEVAKVEGEAVVREVEAQLTVFRHCPV